MNRSTPAILFTALSSLALACAVPETGVPPPTGELYFPVGVVAHPEGRYLYITNGVFDRKFNQGTLVAYDTHTRRVVEDSTLSLGLFAGEVAFRPRGDGALDLLTVARDAGRLYRFELGEDGRVTPGDDTGDFDNDTSVSPDPYGIAVHPDGEITITHLARGVLSHWRIDEGGRWRFRCSANLETGVTSIARHPNNGWLYVTDRLGNRITYVEVVPSFANVRGLDTEAECEIRVQGTIVVDGETVGRTRGLAFSADGKLLFVASSSDRSLRIYDTHIERNGRPANRSRGVITIGDAPNVVRIAGLRSEEVARLEPSVREALGPVELRGQGLVYVTAFDDDRVVVVDPVAELVLARIDVAAGPHDIAFQADAAGHLRAYVTAFGAHALSVIDIDPDSPNRFRSIATVEP